MDERARDAAEVNMMLPLVKRFIELGRKYKVEVSLWYKDDLIPLSMVIKAVEDPERVDAFHLGVKNEEVYLAYKAHDFQCRAALSNGERCEKDAGQGKYSRNTLNLEKFDPNDNRYCFCDFHYRRIPEGKVRLWTNMDTVVEPDDDDESEAA